MITRSDPRWQTADWQKAMQASTRSLDALLQAVGVEPQQLPGYDAAGEAALSFPVRVPPHYLSLMEKGNARDPLLLQVLPQAQEMDVAEGFSADPLAEALSNPVAGLIHKYHGRVLLVTSPLCAIHCRYCFRRHFPYEANTPGKEQWQEAIDYIGARPEIHEVILSGGDPLSLPDSYLDSLLTRLGRIPHLRTVRIHSRLPTAMPERITQELLTVFAGSRLKVVLVIHVNHPRELSPEALAAIALFQQQGVRVFNQSVLLRNVNDNEATLHSLLVALHQADITPYYLHLPDKVAGTAHFEVGEEEAMALFRRLSAQLPGYQLPRFVREKPLADHKIILA